MSAQVHFTNRLGAVRNVVAGLATLLCVAAPVQAQTSYYQWDYNTIAPGFPNFTNTGGAGGIGTATSAAVGAGISSQLIGGQNYGLGTQANGSSDPASFNTNTNYVVETTNYPAAGGASGTHGMQFSNMNTTGAGTNLLFTIDISPTLTGLPASSGSRWYQVQASVNGGGSFSDVGVPIEYRQTTNWANQIPVSLVGVNTTAATDLQIRVVAVHDPSTGTYVPAPPSGTYSSTATVAYDMASVYQAKTFSNASSGNFSSGAGWSGGTAPVSGALSSNVMFGGASSAVTLNQDVGTGAYRLFSMSFTSDAAAYTITGNQFNLGMTTSGAVTSTMNYLTTLNNASSQTQTISAPINLITTNHQTWDSGNAGGKIVADAAVFFGDGVNLKIIGSSQIEVGKTGASFSGFLFSGTSTITKEGSGSLTIAYSTPSAPVFGAGNPTFLVNGGSLVAANTDGGSATGDANVTVNSGGKLTGHGRIAPDTTNNKKVTINSGGKISAGSDVTNKTLTIVTGTGANALAVAGTIEVNIFGTGATDVGQLSVTGEVNHTSGNIGINLSGTSVAALRSAVGFGNSRTYTVVTASAASTYSTAFGSLGGFQASEWSAAQVGNTLQVTFTAAPEPASVLAVAGATVGALAFLRRRRVSPELHPV